MREARELPRSGPGRSRGPTRPLRPTEASAWLAIACAALTTACGDARLGDLDRVPSRAPTAATGPRIADVTDPAKPERPAETQVLKFAEVQVVTVDTFDETGQGATGTVYLRDTEATGPFTAVTAFRPAFFPAGYRGAPGDVVSLEGRYQEAERVGTAVFPAGQVLPQIVAATATFRYEKPAPQPTTIALDELLDYERGRKWIGALVTVNDVRLGPPRRDNANRLNYPLVGNDTRVGPQLSNELFDLREEDYPEGTRIASVTGLVTYFFTLKIAPRSPEDLRE